jgi:hypothetical protein
MEWAIIFHGLLGWELYNRSTDHWSPLNGGPPLSEHGYFIDNGYEVRGPFASLADAEHAATDCGVLGE